MRHTPTARRLAALAGLLALQAPALGQAPTSPPPRHGGWYAGVAAGLARHEGPEEGLIGVLGAAGFNNPSFDDDRDGELYKAFVGYRFEGLPLSLETAWVRLSEIDGDYVVPPPPGGVGGTYEEESEGWQLLARVHAYETEELSVALRVGGWLRETDFDVLAQPGNVRLSGDENDFDVTLGVDVHYRLGERIGLRGEYERFMMDGKEVDVLALGVLFDFGPHRKGTTH